MKKRIFLALTAMLALSFVACGKDKGNNDTSSADSSSVSVSTPAESESSSEDVVTTYAFTKWINRAAGEAVSVELEEGAVLDLTAPATVAGKTFKGWVYADGTAVEEGTTMGTEAIAIYAMWEVQAYPVTINLDGVEDKVYYFGVESVPATETTPEIIDIRSIGWVIANDYADAGLMSYTIEGMPSAEEGWELQAYTINVTSQMAALSEALELGVANADKVTNGTLKLESGDYVIDDISYKLADNYYCYEYVDDYGDTCKKWYVGYEGGVLALQDLALGYISKSYDEIFEGMTDGYAFEMVFDYTNTYYGVENFVAAIYNLSETKVESYDDGVWTFSLTYINEYDTKYDVTVSFSLNDDLAMDNVTIEIGTYYFGEVEIPVLDENGDPVLDENGDPTYTTANYELQPDTSKVYTITQATDGEVVVDYNPAVVLVQDYNITNADGEEVSAIDVVAGQQASLKIANVAEGVQLKWDTFNVTITDAAGIEVDSSFIEVSVNAYGPSINVTGYIEGEYTAVIKSAFTTKTITVAVELPETTEIMAKANEWAWSALTSAEIYADGALNFIVVANKYADASATVEVTTSPEGSDPVVELVGSDYTFTTDVAGEYVITITSNVDSSITNSIAVTVKEVPSIDALLNGQFQNSDKSKDKQLNVTLAYDSSLGMGTMIVLFEKVAYNNWTGEKTGVEKKAAGYVVNYDAATKSFTLTDVLTVNPDAINVFPADYTYDTNLVNMMMLTEDYQVKVYYDNQNQMTILVPYVELSLAQLLAGNYAYDVDENSKYSLTVWEDGTASISLMAYNENYGRWMTQAGAEFDFSADGGVITVDAITGTWPAALEGFAVGSTFAYDQAAGTLTITIGETTVVFA